MADELSPSDQSSLAAERGPVNMAVGAALLFEAGAGLTYDAIMRRLGERLHLIPRYRQRLVEPPLGVSNAAWVDDEHFDVGWHVRQSTLRQVLENTESTKRQYALRAFMLGGPDAQVM